MAKSRVRRTSRWLIALPAALGGAVIGLGFGVLAMIAAELAGGDVPPWLPLGVAGIVGTVALILRAVVIEGSGDLARRVFMGADEGTTPEYSVARGLELRGQFEAAIQAYAEGAEEYPEDPEPLLQGARLLRDRLRRDQEALAWLTRARSIPEITAREEIMIDRELVHLYVDRLGQPEKALPILARMAERHAGTRPAEWAARTLARLRTEVWNTVRDDPTDALDDYHRRVLGRGDPAGAGPHE